MSRAPVRGPWPWTLLALLASAGWGSPAWAGPLLTAAAASASASTTPAAAEQGTALAQQTRGMAHQSGLFELWRDTAKGRVLLGVSALEQPFLLVSSLPFALGSNDVGLDRGQGGEVQMVHFERHGNRLFLLRDNTAYVANSADADERAAVRESFAAAVLWAGDILATEDKLHLVDFSSFLLADRHGVGARLAATKQGSYQVDAARSAVLAEAAKAFPDNLELEALLTFAGPASGEFVRQVAADASSLALRQRISMVRLPALDSGWQPRPYHPFSGGFDVSYVDFATPLASSIDVHWQVRHRLEKTDPAAAFSTVKRPIVYYVDRGAPEPVRSALVAGASWWASAFEKAGYKDAFRVEVLPEGVDAMDIRYNMIHWVHRATRGWSYGNALADPRTGQIIRGAVTLGSQRVRQDILIAESLLAPYGQQAPAAAAQLAEQMALARLRQLAAHEVGHTLGFAHNFAASRRGNGSVMDYPHPLLGLDASGKPTLEQAYGVGVGPWDDYIVRYIYGDFGHGEQEQQALAGLRAAAHQAGLQYVSDQDARSPGASHPDGLLWDFGPDSLRTWDQLGAVRQRALASFSYDVLPDARQAGELEARLVPVYLLQRYQGEALARLLGGASFASTSAGDIRAGIAPAGTRPTPATVQKEALARLSDTFTAEYLALPASVLDVLTPPATGYERGREYFASRMASVFDALSMAEAGAAQTAGFLFDAERLNRLAWQQARDARQPGVDTLLEQVLRKSWQRASVPASLAGGEAVQLAANWVVLDSLLNVLDSGKLHAQVAAQLQGGLRQLAGWLQQHPGQGSTAASRKQAAELILAYLRDPRSVKLRTLPVIPPGAPI
ncbi:zinc-dependent metalloprotease [Pseudoduganella danionis]|uniref:zinc-dependent metalloprotease n=1 Tax=Pseudoduganella danionis TaxID=1890295 RepID=UPI0035B414A7